MTFWVNYTGYKICFAFLYSFSLIVASTQEYLRET
jgi:hypothetical protein